MVMGAVFEENEERIIEAFSDSSASALMLEPFSKQSIIEVIPFEIPLPWLNLSSETFPNFLLNPLEISTLQITKDWEQNIKLAMSYKPKVVMISGPKNSGKSTFV